MDYIYWCHVLWFWRQIDRSWKLCVHTNTQIRSDWTLPRFFFVDSDEVTTLGFSNKINQSCNCMSTSLLKFVYLYAYVFRYTTVWVKILVPVYVGVCVHICVCCVHMLCLFIRVAAHLGTKVIFYQLLPMTLKDIIVNGVSHTCFARSCVRSASFQNSIVIYCCNCCYSIADVGQTEAWAVAVCPGSLTSYLAHGQAWMSMQARWDRIGALPNWANQTDGHTMTHTLIN